MIKKFAHTFFFGYLETKWKRLARVIVFILLAALLYYITQVISFDLNTYINGTLLSYIIWIAATSLTSWVLKPFVVDK